MTELNPSEAQWNAMLAWAQENNPRNPETFLAGLFAAANSVPAGAPVGTIARRPDGEWIANRTSKGWNYQWLDPDGMAITLEKGDGADSWPVIYDPTRPDTDVAALLRQAAARLTELSTDETDNYHLVNDLVDAANRINPTAQQEPEGFAAAQHKEYLRAKAEFDTIATNTRTPRVVDRLGVDEQGSRWWDQRGDEWKFYNGRWHYLELHLTAVPDGEWVEASPGAGYGPYAQIVEPRVLPTLDCPEARDGTVWVDSSGTCPFRYRFHNGCWGQLPVNGPYMWFRLANLANLKIHGPYTEVLGDPS